LADTRITMIAMMPASDKNNKVIIELYLIFDDVLNEFR